MIGLLRVHTWEEYGVVILILLLMATHEIAVRIIRIGLDYLGIDRSSLLDVCTATGIALYVACESLTDEKRTLTILLTIEVLGKREDLVWRVLIHWQLCRRTDDDLCKGRIADEDRKQTEQDIAAETCIELLPQEDTSHESSGYQQADKPAVADEWHTTQHDTG